MSKFAVVILVTVTLACASVGPHKISREEAIKIAETTIRKEYPNVHLSNYSVSISEIVKVSFRRNAIPDVVTTGGGLDVLVDPVTNNVRGVVPMQ
jgi:hypothetical protein